MNNILNIKTPAESQAAGLKSEYGLSNHGLKNLRKVYWNLPTEALYEEIIFRGEANISHLGPLVVSSGEHTARSAQDKFIVREPGTENHIWWGEYNRPIAQDKFEEIFSRMQGFAQGRDLFVQDCYVGADMDYRLPVRIICEYAWHSFFARNMFILPKSAEEYKYFIPEYTVLCLPSFHTSPLSMGHARKLRSC
jgi:phosphoenolpyruvate carboxykinase (ATP)